MQRFKSGMNAVLLAFARMPRSSERGGFTGARASLPSNEQLIIFMRFEGAQLLWRKARFRGRGVLSARKYKSLPSFLFDIMLFAG